MTKNKTATEKTNYESVTTRKVREGLKCPDCSAQRARITLTNFRAFGPRLIITCPSCGMRIETNTPTAAMRAMPQSCEAIERAWQAASKGGK